MEGAALFIGIFGFVAIGAYLKARAEMAEKQRLFDAQKLILDKLGTGDEVREFLESEQGKLFFDRLRNPEKAGPSPEQTANEAVRGLNRTAYGWNVGGIVVFFVGLGFVAATHLTLNTDLYIPAALCVFIGIGMLIAGVVTQRTARNWAEEATRANNRPGTQVS